MSTQTETLTSTGSFTLPDQLLGEEITIEVAGGQGGSPSDGDTEGGGGAIVSATVSAAGGDVVSTTIGEAATGSTPGSGYHNGGTGTEAGGGSTSALLGETLLIEAGGGGGASSTGTTGNGGTGGYPSGSPGSGATGVEGGVAGATGATGGDGSVGGGAGAGPGFAVPSAGSTTKEGTWGTESSDLSALGMDPVNLGDLVVVSCAGPYSTQVPAETSGSVNELEGANVGSLSGGGVSTWTLIQAVGFIEDSFYDDSPTFVDSYYTNYLGLAWGTVTATGPQALICSSADTAMALAEFETGSGWSWGVDNISWSAAVTATNSGELAIFAAMNVASSGSTSGWTYYTAPSEQASLAYKLSASGSESAPTWNYSVSGSDEGDTDIVVDNYSIGITFVPTQPSSGAGGGASYVSDLCSGAELVGTNAGNGYLSITYTEADAPLAPSLVSPGNDGFADAYDDGVVFEATYNAGADSGDLALIALRIKGGSFGSTYHYWTGSGWTTTETWIDPDTASIGVASGETFTLTIPVAELANGETYDWNFATEESSFGLQGPFAGSDFALTAESVPTIAITAPTSLPTTVTPTVSWTDTLGSGDSQTDYEVIYYTEAQVEAEGFEPGGVNEGGTTTPIYDSGVVSSASTSYDTPSAAGLLDSETYYVYVQITETGGNVSNWTGVGFTPTVAGPSAPSSLTVVPSTNATTGNPANLVTVEASGGDFGTVTVEVQYSDDEVNWYDTRWGANLTLVSGSASFLDEEAPFNATRYYRARSIATVDSAAVQGTWTSAVGSEIVSSNWWMSIPTLTGLVNVATLDSAGNYISSDVSSALKLWRTEPIMATTTTTMTSGDVTPSLGIDRPEQQGVFLPLSAKGGRATAIVCRGVMQAEQFAVTFQFWDETADAEFQILDAIRSQQLTVLLRSDMNGACYYVALASGRPVVILREGGRMTNPKRQLVLQVTPVGKP